MTARIPSEEGLAAERLHAREGSGQILLSTKLRPPPARPEHVGRSHLLEQLHAGAARRLTLVVAPAGWGKSTLLGQWLALEDEDKMTAWLSLDESDNDPVRLFSYVIAALRTAEPEIGSNTLAALRVPGVGLADVALPLLVNELALRSEEILLVVDDYHVVDNEDIHEAFAFLVERAPPTLRVALGCRYDPPLPLPRLRGRAELSEIRASELSFSAEEATSFLNDGLRLGLARDEIDRLLERTEGWAAGLYFAALSAQSLGGVQASARGGISGEDRHLVDYFTTEVLDRQPDELRAFLLRTSVLERLSGPLCDSLTERADGVETLEQLERSNLFLVPLDTKRGWYRYHHLFRELLRRELKRADPDLIPILHSRAATWFRGAGAIPEAIRHFTAGRQFAEASDLIAEHWPGFVHSGQLATIISWLEALPDDVATNDARLCVTAGMVWSLLGGHETSERWLDIAEHAPLPRPILDGLSSIESGVAMIRAIRVRTEGDVGHSIDVARGAVELEAKGMPPWRAASTSILGVSLFWAGEFAEARTVLEETVRIGHEEGGAFPVIQAIGFLAALDHEAGEFEAAERLARRGIDLASETSNAEQHAPAMAHLALGEVLEGQGHLGQAETEIRRGLVLARRRSDPLQLGHGLTVLARIRHGRDDPDEARELQREARRSIAGCRDPGIVAAKVNETERQLRRKRQRSAGVVADRYEELSDRELAVLRLLASELSRREIATELYVSHNTMKSHIRTIYRKLGVSSRAQALERARELDLM